MVKIREFNIHSFMHTHLHSFNNTLLCAYFMSDSELDTGDIEIYKILPS